MIWATSKKYTLFNIILRIIKAAIPLSMLYVGKEIIDVILDLISENPTEEVNYLWILLGVEFGLAIISEVLNRQISFGGCPTWRSFFQ